MDQLIESLKQDKGERVSYPLLDVNVKFKSGDVVRYAALNEATLRKVNGTLLCEVYINGELFENFRGDGLCVATPTGVNWSKQISRGSRCSSACRSDADD